MAKVRITGRKKKRDYKKEYREYHGKPEQIARRVDRVQARRKAEKAGKVRKGDGKEVHHVNPNGKTGSLGNETRVVSFAENRRIGHPHRRRVVGKKRRKSTA